MRRCTCQISLYGYFHYNQGTYGVSNFCRNISRLALGEGAKTFSHRFQPYTYHVMVISFNLECNDDDKNNNPIIYGPCTAQSEIWFRRQKCGFPTESQIATSIISIQTIVRTLNKIEINLLIHVTKRLLTIIVFSANKLA